jgi:hypothetical protein
MPGAAEATSKLSTWKTEIEKGKRFKDDAGEVSYSINTVTFTGDKDLLKMSHDNFKRLAALKDSTSENFRKYLPMSMELLPDGSLKAVLWERAVPLLDLAAKFNGEVPQKHVNWVMNRMLEFSAWLDKIGYVHCGLNPDSVFIIPENHGMICTSFYHMTPKDKRISTVSGKYAGFYPQFLFDPSLRIKTAVSEIDVELCTRTGIYLLGDKSGLGTKLRKTHNNEVLDFYSTVHDSAINAMLDHREMIARLFKKEFHKLTV